MTTRKANAPRKMVKKSGEDVTETVAGEKSLDAGKGTDLAPSEVGEVKAKKVDWYWTETPDKRWGYMF